MKNIKILLLALVVAISFFTSCEEPEKDPDAIIYYKAIGKGYVYDATNNRPLKGGSIEIQSVCGAGMSYYTYYYDTVVTNNNGYYEVRFMEKERPSINSVYFEMSEFRIYVKDGKSRFPNWNIVYPSGSKSIRVWSLSELRERDFLSLDTIKFYKFQL